MISLTKFQKKKIILLFLLCGAFAYSSLIECSPGIVLLLEVLSVRAFSHFFFSPHCFQMLQWHCSKKRHDILVTSVPSDLQREKNGNSLALQSGSFFIEGWLANVIILVILVFTEANH